MTKYPTCTESGSYEYRCTNYNKGCTYVEKTTIPATGHNFTEWEITKPATCAETGSKYRYCQNNNCDYEETQTLPKTNAHNWVLQDDLTTWKTVSNFIKTKNAYDEETIGQASIEWAKNSNQTSEDYEAGVCGCGMFFDSKTDYDNHMDYNRVIQRYYNGYFDNYPDIKAQIEAEYGNPPQYIAGVNGVEKCGKYSSQSIEITINETGTYNLTTPTYSITHHPAEGYYLKNKTETFKCSICNRTKTETTKNIQTPATDPNDQESTYNNNQTIIQSDLTRITTKWTNETNRIGSTMQPLDHFFAKSQAYQNMLNSTIPEYVGARPYPSGYNINDRNTSDTNYSFFHPNNPNAYINNTIGTASNGKPTVGNTIHVKWTGTEDTTYFVFAVHNDEQIVNNKARNETLISSLVTQASECALDVGNADANEEIKIYVVPARDEERKTIIECIHLNQETPVNITTTQNRNINATLENPQRNIPIIPDIDSNPTENTNQESIIIENTDDTQNNQNINTIKQQEEKTDNPNTINTDNQIQQQNETSDIIIIDDNQSSSEITIDINDDQSNQTPQQEEYVIIEGTNEILLENNNNQTYNQQDDWIEIN